MIALRAILPNRPFWTVRGENEIKYIAVLWVKNTYNLSSMRDVGHYTDPQDSTRAGSITVPLNSIVNSIDITVDYNQLEL